MFNPDVRDAYNDPYIYLRERLLDKNYQLMTADENSLDDCEWIFFFDISSVFPYSGIKGNMKKLIRKATGKPLIRDLFSECQGSSLKDRAVLFLWEAPAVYPANWNMEFHKLFSVIFTWNDSVVDNKRYFKIFWPQTRFVPDIPPVPFAEKKLLVNISMNKYSSHERELYSERRGSIEYFEKNHPDNFDLYGIGWNHPARYSERLFPFIRHDYKSYKGTVKNKWDVFQHYRFSICYENIRDETGWVTEKIFDSMRCCCVPIYWGAPNIRDFVDEDAFIDRRNFGSNEELGDYILGINAQRYQKYQDAIRNYLAGEKFKKFLPENFADTIINVLKL